MSFLLSDAACTGFMDVLGADRDVVHGVALRSEGKALLLHCYSQDYSAVMSLASPGDSD